MAPRTSKTRVFALVASVAVLGLATFEPASASPLFGWFHRTPPSPPAVAPTQDQTQDPNQIFSQDTSAAASPPPSTFHHHRGTVSAAGAPAGPAGAAGTGPASSQDASGLSPAAPTARAPTPPLDKATQFQLQQAWTETINGWKADVKQVLPVILTHQLSVNLGDPLPDATLLNQLVKDDPSFNPGPGDAVPVAGAAGAGATATAAGAAGAGAPATTAGAAGTGATVAAVPGATDAGAGAGADWSYTDVVGPSTGPTGAGQPLGSPRATTAGVTADPAQADSTFSGVVHATGANSPMSSGDIVHPNGPQSITIPGTGAITPVGPVAAPVAPAAAPAVAQTGVFAPAAGSQAPVAGRLVKRQEFAAVDLLEKLPHIAALSGDAHRVTHRSPPPASPPPASPPPASPPTTTPPELAKRQSSAAHLAYTAWSGYQVQDNLQALAEVTRKANTEYALAYPTMSTADKARTVIEVNAIAIISNQWSHNLDVYTSSIFDGNSGFIEETLKRQMNANYCKLPAQARQDWWATWRTPALQGSLLGLPAQDATVVSRVLPGQLTRFLPPADQTDFLSKKVTGIAGDIEQAMQEQIKNLQDRLLQVFLAGSCVAAAQ